MQRQAYYDVRAAAFARQHAHAATLTLDAGVGQEQAQADSPLRLFGGEEN